MSGSGHQLKVLNPIVVTYTVSVVDDLIRGYRSPDVFRHHQDMFGNVASLGRVGMIGSEDKHIPLRSPNATFPSGIIRSSPGAFRSSHTTILPQITNSCSSTFTRGGFV